MDFEGKHSPSSDIPLLDASGRPIHVSPPLDSKRRRRSGRLWMFVGNTVKFAVGLAVPCFLVRLFVLHRRLDDASLFVVLPSALHYIWGIKWWLLGFGALIAASRVDGSWLARSQRRLLGMDDDI